MLTIERCRRLLGAQAEDMSDGEISKVRDTLSALARLCIDDYLRIEDITKQ
ncbi:MAG: hypothetical protein PHO20_00805 [Candidatus Peribacteraceae bacterium]|nr:hypothetical protein [Candidatus Peribacteraceae bacterium]MDD5739289.1 hypothetical protein [Candidatus Peribacteraceae bacterium]